MIKVINNFKILLDDISKRLLFDHIVVSNKINADCVEGQFEICKLYLVIMYTIEYEGDYFTATLYDKQFNEIDEKFFFLDYIDLEYKDAVPISDNQIQVTFTNNASVVIQICKIPFLPIKPFIWIRKWKRPNNK
jgi:hypothetical protein